MLEHLFGSKTRVKLITLFIKHQEEAFFIRELTRRIDTQINAVRREIDNLARLGLIIEGVGNEELPTKRPGLKRKYYQINAKFPLLPEIQSLMNKANFLMEKRLD
jgi:predicted transcriptional regulator